ncbi:hypothetical protein ACHAXN_006490 [Cyclotella atomus]
MKLPTFLALALLRQANGLSCPELTNSESITSTLTMYYAVVTSAIEPSILCARLESESESWVAVGINPSGEMIGADAIIGLPDDGTVKKYVLEGKSIDAIVEMDGSAQTLMDTSITQENGMTIMSFTKYLDEDQYSISEGANTFIYAVGSGNELNYHASRGSFTLEVEAAGAASTSSTTGATVIETLPTPTSTTGASSTVALVSTDTTAVVSPTYSPTIGDDNVTFAPTTVGTATVDVGATPAPSVVSKPLMRTAEPTLASGDDGSIVDWNQTDDMVDSNETSTASSTAADSTESFGTTSTAAAGNETESETPSPTVVGAGGDSAQPTFVSTSNATAASASNSTSDATTSDKAGAENAESATQQEFNGATSTLTSVCSLFAGFVALVTMI